MTPYEQLDYILLKCKTIAIKNTLASEMRITQTRLTELIVRLQNDGYIIRSDVYSADSYTLTFEGEMFEGYVNRQIRIASENARLEKLENRQRINQIWMIWLTVILAVGTAIVAWKESTEIWEYYWPDKYWRLF